MEEFVIPAGFKSALGFAKGSGRRGSIAEVDLTFGTYKGSGSKSSYAIAISVSKSFAQKASMKPGDRVNFLWDDDQRVGILCKHSQGYTLSGGHKQSRNRFRASITWSPGMPCSAKTIACLAEPFAGRIVFIMPDDIVFGKHPSEVRNTK